MSTKKRRKPANVTPIVGDSSEWQDISPRNGRPPATSNGKPASPELKFHPLANLFPLMDDRELNALAEDIRANGQRENITIFEGKILDGRNRYRACRIAGVEPRTVEVHAMESPATFVVSVNLHRRHLTESQRSIIGAKAQPVLAGEAKKKQREAGRLFGRGKQPKVVPPVAQANGEPRAPAARDHAAKLVGVGHTSIDAARRIVEADPALAERILAGGPGAPTVKAGKRELDRREKKRVLEQKAKDAAEDLKQSGECPWQIMHNDCIKALNHLHVRPRLIFADPPYNLGVDYGDGAAADQLPREDYLVWCDKWIERCAELLAGDGSMWLLIGDEYAAELAVALKNAGLTIRSWIKWYETFGVNCANNFNRCSRHLFYCVRDPKQFVFHAEAVNRPSARQQHYGDRRADAWGKIWDDVWQIPRLVGTAKERIPDFPTQLPLDLLRPIVGCTSDPGDLVLDPFCGSATTGVAAVELGRRFLGIEKQKRFVDLATLRLKGMKR